jgi:CheY-like chemotaxis protein
MMLKRQRKLLVIDDDPMVHFLVEEGLSSQVEIILQDTGEAGIKAAHEHKPDLILLDVSLPDISGFEVCKKLKSESDFVDTPVIFVSSNTDQASHIKGFTLGASDYVDKPFSPDEVKARIEQVFTFMDQRDDMASQIGEATNAAFAAMRGSSELGLAVQFIEAIHGISDLQTLANTFFGVTNSLDIRCSLLLEENNERFFFKSDGMVAPLEQQVMNVIHDRQERFTDFENRTIITYPKATLLIKNMPKDDAERYGHLKDLLPSMMGSTDARMMAIGNEKAVTELTRETSTTVDHIKDTLSEVGSALEQNQTDVVGLLKGLLDEFELRIPRMGLEEDQEVYLINTLDATINAAQDIIESSHNTSASFQAINRLLHHISARQKQILGEMESKHESESTPADTEASKADDGIELF